VAALTLIAPTGPQPGTIVTPNAASASDTITQAQLGTRGVNLRIATAGTTSNISITDAGTTPSGNPGTITPIAMAATQVRYVYISPTQVNLGTGFVTVTSSSQTALTYEVIPA
jgi:hypothetical protein